ncbi:hypothetical protein ACLKA7_015553 [Drosophila subpalustris]
MELSHTPSVIADLGMDVDVEVDVGLSMRNTARHSSIKLLDDNAPNFAPSGACSNLQGYHPPYNPLGRNLGAALIKRPDQTKAGKGMEKAFINNTMAL